MGITTEKLDALRVQFESRFQDVLEVTPTWSDQISTEIDSDGESNLYGFVENSIEIQEWIGERDVSVLEESEYRLTNRHFQGATRINRDKIADDKLGMWMQIDVPLFAQRVAKFDDHQLADILLNNAVAYDGENFFDPNHNNSFNNALDANGIAFAAARAKLRTFTDPTGAVRYVGDQFTLVVSPDLERTAELIVAAEWGPVAGTAGTAGISHASNVNRGKASVLVVPELVTNPNRWFLFATGMPIRALIRQKRQQPETVIVDSKESGGRPYTHNENEYGTDFRAAYGVSFPWLAIANDPDGAMT